MVDTVGFLHNQQFPTSSPARSHARLCAMDESLATPVAVHPTAWDPSSARAVLNVTLDAALVPSSEPGGCRADAAHVVVLDGLLEGAGCSSIRERLCPPPGSPLPADSLWERRTADTAGGARTFGLRDDALAGLITRPPPGLLELQSRLALLYPEATLCHQPRVGGADDGFACERLVANAACGGDSFAWHQDADPATFPPGAWADAHGRYANRERGRPLFLSALLYLDAEWPLANDAETLFLDPPTGCGVFVRPSQGRVVLMDQVRFGYRTAVFRGGRSIAHSGGATPGRDTPPVAAVIARRATTLLARAEAGADAARRATAAVHRPAGVGAAVRVWVRGAAGGGVAHAAAARRAGRRHRLGP